MAAKYQQMRSEQPLGIEQSYDVRCDSRHPIDSRCDTEFCSRGELSLDRAESFAKLALVPGELAEEFLRPGRAQTQRSLMAHPVQRLYQVLPPAHFLPVHSAAEFSVLVA